MTFKRCILLASALGVVGLLFRLAVWGTAYDQEAKLVTNPRLIVIFNLFFVLCAVLAVVNFYSRWPADAAAVPPYSTGGIIAKLVQLSAAVCSLGAGGLLLPSQDAQGAVIVQIEGVLLILQGMTLVLLTLQKDHGSSFFGTLLLIPTFGSCCWLVAFYHQVGGIPNRETYLWPVLAGILCAACWVAYAGFYYQRQTGRWFGMVAVTLAAVVPVALAAPLSLAWRLSLGGQWLWMCAALLCLKPEVPAPVPEADLPQTVEIESGN